MEAFFDRWAQFLWSFVTPRRARRCLVVGTITAAIVFVAGWALMPPQPRWMWSYNSYRQFLVGFSPGGRWFAVAGYRGVPQNEVLWIWDLQSGSSEPRHSLVLPWTAETGNLLQRQYQDGSIFQWSSDDRELLYVAPPSYTERRPSVHFVELEHGTETDPWLLPELTWTRPEQPSLEPLRPLPVETVEFSPRSNWLILRCEEGVAVADRNTRTILFALGNVAHAVMEADDRHLLVQELAVTQSAPDVVEKRPSNWTDYDLVTGQQTKLDPQRAPSSTAAAPSFPFQETASANGHQLARLAPYAPNRPGFPRLRMFDLPFRPPWEQIVFLAVCCALAVIVLLEMGIGWKYGFEVSQSAGPEDGE